MAKRYCRLCNRYVEAKKQYGVGTLIFIIFTGGFGLLFLPFYRKRCCVCKGDKLDRR